MDRRESLEHRISSRLNIVIALAVSALVLSMFTYGCGGETVKPDKMELKTEPQGQFDKEQASWQGIVPGITTEQEVIAILGKPVEIEVKDDRQYYLYPASEGGGLFRNSIGVINGKVVAMLIYPSEGAYSTLEQVVARYGESEEVTFSHFDSGTRVHIFANAGLAVTAYERDGVIAQSLYFVQMALDEFMDTYGRNLPKTDPFRK